MKRVLMIISMLLTCYSTTALAAEGQPDATSEEKNLEAFAAESSAAIEEVAARNAAGEELNSGESKMRLEAPNGELFGNYKIKPARKAAIGGYVMSGLVFGMSAMSWYFLSLANVMTSADLEITDENGNKTNGVEDAVGHLAFGFVGIVGYAYSLLVQNFIFGITAITAPILNAQALRSGAWHQYRKHTLIDALSWSFYGVGMGFGIMSIVSYALPSEAFSSLEGFWGYINFVTIGCTMFSIASLAMFATKGVLAYKTAKKLNEQQQALYDANRRKIVVAPTASPLVDNNKVVGGTIGLVASF